MASLPQRKLLDPAVLMKLGNLPIVTRSAMIGSVAGKHKSPYRGSSVEFAEYRKYVPGDDTRRLDWRAYGRSDRFYIKEFEADTNLRLLLVVDVSGSMRFGAPGGLTKLEYAKRIAATLAYLAMQQGDAVGLSLASSKLSTEIRPSRRASHMATINNTLESITPTGETGLIDVIHDIAEKNRPRALVVIASDFFVDTEPLEGAFRHLRFRNHDVCAFQLMEKREIDFDFKGTIRFVDLEGGPSYMTDPAEIAPTYRAALAKHMNALDRIAAQSAIEFHRVSIEEPYVDVLARFLLGRAKKGVRR